MMEVEDMETEVVDGAMEEVGSSSSIFVPSVARNANNPIFR